MSTPARTVDTVDVHGPAAPPRDNGELVFTAPWESRAFGLVMALVETGRFSYARFRSALVVEIQRDGARPYYESWLDALSGLLRETVDEQDVVARVRLLADGDDHHPGVMPSPAMPGAPGHLRSEPPS